MILNFLGTGAGIPSLNRNASGLVVDLSKELGCYWLFDCGEGTQTQLIRSGVSYKDISKIFITHLHGDHILGLIGLLSTMNNSGKEKSDVVDIIGPEGLEKFIKGNLSISKTFLKFKLNFIVVKDGDRLVFKDSYKSSGYKVVVKELMHDIKCFGYSIIQNDLPGILDVDKAESLGVPFGPLMGKLKNGNDVSLNNGIVIKSSDVIGESLKGFKICIFGDTKFDKSFIDFIKNSDVLIYESTYFEGGSFGNVKNKYYHSSNLDALKLAVDGNVKHLLLNHISPRFSNYDIKNLNLINKKHHKSCFIVNDLDKFEFFKGKFTKIGANT